MTPGIPRAARIRAYVAGVVVSLGLTGVAYRAWGLQVGESEHYRQLADKQHAVAVGIPAPRGEILDARGRPLAVSADADSIWANPREIRDVTDTADRLGKLLGEEPAALEAKLGRNQRFVWLDRHVAPEVAKAVKAAKLPGIEVSKEPRRWYPGKIVGGTVIGKSDIDGNGVDGIELSMNAQLVGHRGAGLALRDARGKKMFADGLERPEPGATVQLSIDGSIQAIAEAAVEDSVRVNKAKAGVAVVLEVGTGRVVAMASAPARDPNGSEGQASARNHAVADSYEAGSVIKVFSIAAALDDGLITPTTEFDLGGGQLKLPGRATPIRDVDKDPYLDVAGIIRRSSNVGAAKIALRFGSAKLYAAYKRFGFGARTGIELPGEQPGMLRNGAKWRDVELATIAYGYGLTVTPLQVAAALAAFGDGGMYREPRIVDRVTDPDGTVLYQAAPAARRVVSEKTAAQMKAMLAGVFEGGKTHGTASNIVVPGFRCGGKTGTAHKYDPALRGYSPDHYLSTFAGLAPIDNPRLAIVVLVDDPVGGDYFGAKVAGPVFARIASEGLRYLGVPGTSAICPPPVPGAPPSIEPRTCLPAPPAPKPAAKPASVATNAAGAPANAVNAAGTAAATGARATAANAARGNASWDGPREPFADDVPPVSVALDPNADERDRPSAPQVQVPDLRGLGMARAIAAARAAHLGIAVEGTGRVVAQDPAPGTTGATRVTLRFSDGNSTIAAAARAAL
jgi:cell division protein FtsI (penicillin-binding protein 3)